MYIAFPELCSCQRMKIYTLIFTKEGMRYCFFVKLDAISFETRVRYVVVPSDLEIIDISIKDDWSKIKFYNSNGVTQFFDTKIDMEMNVKAGEFNDYRKYIEYTFNWNKIKPVKKNSILG